jgi:hypothetical protein
VFQRRPRRAVLIMGTIAALALVTFAGTQALAATPGGIAATSTVRVTSAQVEAIAAAPESTPSCATINDRGNGKYATDRVNDLYPYFEAQSDASTYCNVTVTQHNGTFEIWDPTTGGCLAPESDNLETTVHEDTAAACTGNANGKDDYAWDDWYGLSVGTYHSQTVWAFFSFYNGGCLYDDLQEPAVTTDCTSTGQYQTDTFMWFVWDALP